MSKKKIRIGIELDHVVRNINKQLAKYYQKEYDSSIDLDDLDYKNDILTDLCEFDTEEEKFNFLYSDYPYEIFGMAEECQRSLSRDINAWLFDLSNVKDYDIEVFYYSMREIDLSIPSTLFFLSKIAVRVREVRMPRNFDELYELGDIFITADPKVAKFKNKGKIVIKNNFNEQAVKNADLVYGTMREFLNDENKLAKTLSCLKENKNSQGLCGLWTWITSHLSSLVLKLKIG